jgi:hypothetical protein
MLFRRGCSEQGLDLRGRPERKHRADQLVVEREQLAVERGAVRLDGRCVAAGHRPGERLGRGAMLERLQSAAREREERRPREGLGGARGVLERLDGAGKERHLAARGQHGGRVVERARGVAHRDRRHPERPRDLLQGLAGGSVRACDSGGGVAQRGGRASAGNRSKRMQRARAGAGVERRLERREAEGARAVGDELAAPEQGSDAPAHLFDGPVADRQEDQLRCLDPFEVGLPAALFAAVPGQHDSHAGPVESGHQHLADGAAAQDGSRLRQKGHRSGRNSTPAGPAQASSRSPARIRPARIWSASGDSTNRWIVCRIGRAPSASCQPPWAIK